MTSQPPSTSLLEAATQAVTGMAIGFCVVFVVTWLRLSPATSAAVSVALMFVASIVRGYLIRRRFERSNLE